MAFDIIRLVVTDWARLLADIGEHGANFYWDRARKSDGDIVPPDYTRVYAGPLASMSSRERDAREWYRCLRPALSVPLRLTFDALFGSLFGVEGHDLRLNALTEVAPRLSHAGVWNALPPAQVRHVLEGIRGIDWFALEAAAEAAPPLGTLKYLPDFDGFEMHINNHKTHLAYAQKRKAGVVGLTSM